MPTGISTTRGRSAQRLAAGGLRVELDERQEKIGYKIREAQLQKIPYMLVIGDREAAEGTVVGPASRRTGISGRDGAQEFIEMAKDEVRATRRQDSAVRTANGGATEADSWQRQLTARLVGGSYRIRPKPAAGRPHPGQRTDQGPRGARHRRHRAAAGHHAAAAGADDRPQKGLDLVEIAATAVPPVCRIMDFGRYQYQEQKRARQAKKHQKIIEVKEIKFRPKVDEHDYQFKKKHIERFLADGDKVKATIFFRGREMAHPEIGRRILERLIEDLTEVAIAETTPRQEGNQMHTILSQQAGAKRPAPKRDSEPEPAPEQEAQQYDDDEFRTQESEERDHAETENTPGRRQAVQEDRHRKVHAQQGVQAPHPDEQDPQRASAALRGTFVVAPADQAKLRLMLPD